MYIRRKVFSVINEKQFSTTEFKTQKEFADKKEESKKEKNLKKATIGGAAIGATGSAGALGAEIGRKKLTKKIAKLEEKVNTPGNGIKARKATMEQIEKLQKLGKGLKKGSKAAAIIGAAGVGASVAGGAAYKKASKKKD